MRSKLAISRWGELGERLGLLLALPTLLLLFAAAIYAIGDAVFAPAPAPKDPGFIDTVLGSRAVVAAIRLAIIFAGAFVVVSVVALIARRQWLNRIGPVQVSEQVSDIDAENQRLKESLEGARETIDNLEQDLAETNYQPGSNAARLRKHEMTPREQLEKRIEENRRAIEQARRVGERIDRTIRDSDRRSERARAILKRAGYLREVD